MSNRRSWSLILATLLVLLLSSHALASVEPLTAEQRDALEAGEPWILHERAREDELAGTLRALVEIDATEERVWEAVLDFETMASRSGQVRSVTRYRDTVDDEVREIGLAYHLKVFVRDVHYALHHDYDAGQHVLTWQLDPARDHDLRQLEGSFRTAPGRSPGTTLLVYESRVDTGLLVPEWVERHLRTKALRQFLDGIREGAEVGSA